MSEKRLIKMIDALLMDVLRSQQRVNHAAKQHTTCLIAARKDLEEMRCLIDRDPEPSWEEINRLKTMLTQLEMLLDVRVYERAFAAEAERTDSTIE